MHRFLLPLFLLLGSPLAAQPDTLKPEPIDLEALPSNDGSMTRLAEEAQFPGGDGALMRYMQENLRYPEEMDEAGIQGKVFIRFTIGTDGKVSEASVLRGVEGGAPLEQEALRVVRAMPAWKPAKVNGVSIPTEHTLPVTFQLD